MSNYRNFTRSEFACPCGCNENKIDASLIQILDYVRSSIGFALKVNSGYRCEAHNKAIGGSKTSSHLEGWAADIAMPSSKHAFHFIEACMKYGIERAGLYSTFVHVDIDSSKEVSLFRGKT